MFQMILREWGSHDGLNPNSRTGCRGTAALGRVFACPVERLSRWAFHQRARRQGFRNIISTEIPHLTASRSTAYTATEYARVHHNAFQRGGMLVL